MNVRVLENKLQGSSLLGEPTLRAALSELPHNEAAPALLEIAENAEQQRRGLLKKVVAIGIMCFVVFFGVRLPLIFSPLRHVFWLQIIGAILTVVPVALPMFFDWFFAPRKVWQTLQNAVAALLLCPPEARFLPHLVDGLNAGKTPEWKMLLYPALTAALWNAQSDDLALRLDAPRRAALRAFVTYDLPSPLFPRSKTRVSTHFDDATTDLTVSAMRALAYMGDKKTAKVLQRIIRTNSGLRNETVVRDAAREFLPVLQKRIEETETAFEYLRTLAEKTPRASHAAISGYVDTFAAQDARPLLVQFLREQERRANRSRWLASGGLLAVLGALALVCSALDRFPALIGVSTVVFAPILSHFTGKILRPETEPAAGKIAYELARRTGDDTRVVAALLRAQQLRLNKNQSDAVKKALSHLLPLLHLGDAALVPPDARGSLRGWLTVPRGAWGRATKNRAIVALNALAAIGDTDALRRVEAVLRYAETSTRADALRQTAERCADALKVRKPLV